MKRLSMFVLFLLFLLSTGCAVEVDSSSSEEINMVFMAGYKPQANLPFVGVYVAQEKGFFAEENLNVNIQHSNGSGQHLQLLASGEVQVTTQDAAVLLKRRDDPGLPLVSIALIGQKGQQAFAALSSSGFETPLDWEGHLVGYKGTPPPDLYAMLIIVGADLDKIEFVNVGFDPRVLTEGSVDVYPVYKSNEPYLIHSWGYEDLKLWDAADYGVPTLGLNYVTTDEILAEQPEMLERFLRASMRGIEYARDHIEETVDIVMIYAGEESDPDHMRYMLETELLDLESDVTKEFGLGWQTKDQWQALAELLYEYELISDVSVVDEVFTNQVLEEIQ